MSFDLVIKNGRIVDGCGNPWLGQDLGIKRGKIEKIGEIAEETADRTIDAAGLVVAPGFIAIHSHDDVVFFEDPLNKAKLQQGVTTVVNGNCGVSVAPVNRETIPFLNQYTAEIQMQLDFTKWRSFAEFLDRLEQIPTGMNVASLVGHGALRIAVMGFDSRRPTAGELAEMKNLLAQSMEEGAFGMSTGLIYPPGAYSETEELVELSKVVSRYGGLYATHMRDEGDLEPEAIEEALRIARDANVPVQISHHKISNKANWGKSIETLARIKRSRADGVDVTADAYPYTAGSATLTALFPPWVYAGGEQRLVERLKDRETRREIRKYIEERTDWQNFVKGVEGWQSILISATSQHPEYEGKSLLEISQELSKDPYEALFDLAADEGAKCMMVIFLLDEADVERIVCDPGVAVITDAVPHTHTGKPHPRGFGTYPKVLGRYVREKGLITMEEAIRKMTSLPAQRFNLKTKGLLREGFDADVTIFDPKTIIDRATYQDPRVKPSGIEYVIVNGAIVLSGNEFTEERPGRVIRRT